MENPSSKYSEALYYLGLLENLSEKEVLNHLHKLSLSGEVELLQALYEQGKLMAEDTKLPSKHDFKKTGLSLIGWAADQKHVQAMLYLLNQQLADSKLKYQQHDDYYKLIQQAEKIKVKLQKIIPTTPEEKSEHERLLEETDLIIDDRKNFFKK